MAVEGVGVGREKRQFIQECVNDVVSGGGLTAGELKKLRQSFKKMSPAEQRAMLERLTAKGPEFSALAQALQSWGTTTAAGAQATHRADAALAEFAAQGGALEQVTPGSVLRDAKAFRRKRQGKSLSHLELKIIAADLGTLEARGLATSGTTAAFLQRAESRLGISLSQNEAETQKLCADLTSLQGALAREGRQLRLPDLKHALLDPGSAVPTGKVGEKWLAAAALLRARREHTVNAKEAEQLVSWLEKALTTPKPAAAPATPPPLIDTSSPLEAEDYSKAGGRLPEGAQIDVADALSQSDDLLGDVSGLVAHATTLEDEAESLRLLRVANEFAPKLQQQARGRDAIEQRPQTPSTTPAPQTWLPLEPGPVTSAASLDLFSADD